MWMAIWKIGPALAAGNSVVLKPASATPLTTIRLAELGRRGRPARRRAQRDHRPGRRRRGRARRPSRRRPDQPDRRLGDRQEDPGPGRGQRQAGPSRAGRQGAVHRRRPTPTSRRPPGARPPGALTNGGQDCTAATRAYVHRSLYGPFLARTKELFESVRVGDPFDPSTDLGHADQPGPGGPRRRLRPAGPGGRRDDRDRRRAPVGRRAARWRVLRPDPDRRRGSGQRDRPAGGLRAGPRRAAVRYRRRGDRAGQRHEVRPGCLDLDPRRLPGDGGGPVSSTSATSRSTTT